MANIDRYRPRDRNDEDEVDDDDEDDTDIDFDEDDEGTCDDGNCCFPSVANSPTSSSCGTAP